MQKLVYWVGALFALLIIIGFALPRTHQVEVNIEIDARPATVFALINDFRRISAWSPWAKNDPNARILYLGSERGQHAIVTWDGAISGGGTQLITQSRRNEYVEIILSPGEPGEAKSWFALTPGDGTTIVTWGFEADYGMNIVGRYFAGMLGSIVARDHHDGLLRLKDFAEGLPAADFGNVEIERLVVEPDEIAYLPATSEPEPAAISEAMGNAYFQILNFIDAHGLTDAGAPLSIMRNFSGSKLTFDAAIPVRGVTDETPHDSVGVKIGLTYEGTVIRVKHIGSYRLLTGTHRKISAYLAALGIERNGAAWESYVSDPSKVPEKDLLTYVYYPIKVD